MLPLCVSPILLSFIHIYISSNYRDDQFHLLYTPNTVILIFNLFKGFWLSSSHEISALTRQLVKDSLDKQKLSLKLAHSIQIR
jgi:hypothetical protein